MPTGYRQGAPDRGPISTLSRTCAARRAPGARAAPTTWNPGLSPSRSCARLFRCLARPWLLPPRIRRTTICLSARSSAAATGWSAGWAAGAWARSTRSSTSTCAGASLSSGCAAAVPGGPMPSSGSGARPSSSPGCTTPTSSRCRTGTTCPTAAPVSSWSSSRAPTWPSGSDRAARSTGPRSSGSAPRCCRPSRPPTALASSTAISSRPTSSSSATTRGGSTPSCSTSASPRRSIAPGARRPTRSWARPTTCRRNRPAACPQVPRATSGPWARSSIT